MPTYKLGEFLSDINVNKTNLLRQDEFAHKDFSPFVVTRSLSYFKDLILYINDLNMTQDMSKQMQYDYLINIVKKRKRFSRWAKTPKVENLDLIKDYYNYSDKKALEVIDLLSEEDITKIKIKMNKGGRNGRL